MPRSLPARPNLDHLKREAKRLLRGARAGEPDALTLLEPILRPSDRPPQEHGRTVSLHDVQHALARDYGFPGWKDLKRHVETLTPALEAARPVLRVDSYEQAVAHYVGWLGFSLDWDWREAPGTPCIASFSRDGFSFMINEHPDTLGPTQVHVHVKNFAALVDEWNGRRPGAAEPRIAPPYEFPDLPIEDPFGNVFVFEGQDLSAQQNQRNAVMPKMRDYVRQELAVGRGFPTPEMVRDAVGPPLGLAIEVLNEFPEYGAAYEARRAAARAADDEP